MRSLARRRRVPSLAQWAHLPSLLSPKEHKVWYGAFAAAALSIVFLLGWGYVTHTVTVPARGGTYTEGLIGSPQFVNPLYAHTNDVDQDLARLIYSGLMKWDPNAGLIPDLAESYTVSDDEKVYTFSLRNDAAWHNGTPVTPRDIIFTFHAIQDPSYGSPAAATFQSVSVEQVDERTVSFVLDEPFAPFLSTLTIGILPAEVWGELDPATVRLAERNLIPLGSGPYKFEELEKDRKGIVKSYTVSRFGDFYGGAPFLETITFKFYPDMDSALDALRNRRVEGIAFAPKESLKDVSGQQILTPSLPQITALFFNLKSATVADRELRVALGAAINKSDLIKNVLQGQAAEIHSPILPTYQTASDVYANQTPYSPEIAAQKLDALGWTVTEGSTMRSKTVDGEQKTLTLKITTIDQPETVSVANRIADLWKQVGVDAQVEAVASTTFRDETLKTRSYD
ncbi:MAG: peptide ABC transporter substrate-binding protein, partial [Patescibacteria group bacterium]